MLNTILQTIINVIFFLLRWVFNLILLPLKPIMNIFPFFGQEFIDTTMQFMEDYIFKPITFAKQVFINLTGFPQILLTISANFALTLVSFYATLRILKFVKNIYSLIRSGK